VVFLVQLLFIGRRLTALRRDLKKAVGRKLRKYRGGMKDEAQKDCVVCRSLGYVYV